VRGNFPDLIRGTVSDFMSGERDVRKYLSQDNLCPGRDSNLPSTEYISEALPRDLTCCYLSL
jgi:hypothetical protein